jgi:hypothetical protein
MRTIARGAALLACAVVSACGDSGQAGTAPVRTISGNWYLIDPSAPPTQGQLNEIGAALLVQNGRVTGNATVAISDASNQCASYGLDLPLTGSVDGHGHLALHATDNVDTLALSATLDPSRSAFANGAYTAIGAEAYPQTAPATGPCTTPSGKLDGTLMAPVNASYVGTLRTTDGASILVTLTTHQDTIPLAGMSSGAHPAIITHGNMVFLVGGFAVTGTMQLTHSVCGVTGGMIQPQNGYVWGTVLQIEFDTDTSYHQGATFETYIDPATGALNVVGARLYSVDATHFCSAAFVPGTLTRQ